MGSRVNADFDQTRSSEVRQLCPGHGSVGGSQVRGLVQLAQRFLELRGPPSRVAPDDPLPKLPPWREIRARPLVSKPRRNAPTVAQIAGLVRRKSLQHRRHPIPPENAPVIEGVGNGKHCNRYLFPAQKSSRSMQGQVRVVEREGEQSGGASSALMDPDEVGE